MNPELFKILLVDDRQENLLTLENILESPDLQLIKASSGNEALAKLWEHDIALVLMDVQMPEMDGFEVAEIMRSREKTRSIPIIFITAISKERKHIFRGYDTGAVDYLYKPLDIEILRSKIKAYIELFRHRYALQQTTVKLEQTVAELAKAKQVAEEATRAKSIFLATMSHEIRTPLNGIIGMAELMMMDLMTPDQSERMRAIKESGESLLEIINDILDLSKIEANRLELELIQFSLREVCRKTTKLIAQKAYEKDLELRLNIPPDTPDLMVGDPVRVRQVLINLLGNAIKFTASGSVTLSINTTTNSNGLTNYHFAVEDTGIGINPEKITLLFDTYKQAEVSTSRKFGGTGLGLYISQKLVNQMGGSIAVESTPGKGSRFCFSIPVQSSETTEPVHAAQAPHNTALIIGNDQYNNSRMAEQLRFWNYEVEVASWLQGKQLNPEQHAVTIVDAESFPDYYELSAEIITCLKKNPNNIILTAKDVNAIPDTLRQNDPRIPVIGKPFISGELEKILTKEWGQPTRQIRVNQSIENQKKRVSVKILMAEDQVINRKIAVGMLQKQGHLVVEAENGVIAIEKYLNERFDLILMDVQMPEMDGYEATRKIRDIEDAAGIHTPIVAMTAHAMKGDKEKSLASGMDAHITKPFKAAELYDLIDELTSQNTGK